MDLKNSYVVLVLTGLVVVGMFGLAALGKMDSTMAVSTASAFVMGVLAAWKRGTAPESE